MNIFRDTTVSVAPGQAVEVPSHSDGPKQWCRLQADFVDNLVHEFEGSAARAIPLVDDRNDGKTARFTHPEELKCLGLQALRAVDEHDGGIYSGEDAVSILRKVCVTRGVN